MPQTVDISGEGIRIQINETSNKISVLHGSKNNLEFNTELQSTLTSKMIKDILTKDNSFLPSLKDSYFVHCELFRIFNSHLNKVNSSSKLIKCLN